MLLQTKNIGRSHGPETPSFYDLDAISMEFVKKKTRPDVRKNWRSDAFVHFFPFSQFIQTELRLLKRILILAVNGLVTLSRSEYACFKIDRESPPLNFWIVCVNIWGRDLRVRTKNRSGGRSSISGYSERLHFFGHFEMPLRSRNGSEMKHFVAIAAQM